MSCKGLNAYCQVSLRKIPQRIMDNIEETEMGVSWSNTKRDISARY